MHKILLLVMLMATLADAAWSDYEEARDLALDAADLGTLGIEAGAGSLEVVGISNSERITVSAVITVPDAGADEAAALIRERMVLSLERKNGGRAELRAYFEPGRRGPGDSPSIRLEVHVPARMSLDIEDGSGSIDVAEVSGDLHIPESGSGSVTVRDVQGRVVRND